MFETLQGLTQSVKHLRIPFFVISLKHFKEIKIELE